MLVVDSLTSWDNPGNGHSQGQILHYQHGCKLLREMRLYPCIGVTQPTQWMSTWYADHTTACQEHQIIDGISWGTVDWWIMVYCVVIGCSNKSDCNRGIFSTGSQRSFSEEVRELELSWKRREDYLAVISQADIMDSVIKNGRICSDHFLTGKPAALIDNTSPNWLPTENLSHSIVSRKRVATCQERYQRKKAHFGWMNDQAQQTSQSKAGLIDGTCNES